MGYFLYTMVSLGIFVDECQDENIAEQWDGLGGC